MKYSTKVTPSQKMDRFLQVGIVFSFFLFCLIGSPAQQREEQNAQQIFQKEVEQLCSKVNEIMRKGGRNSMDALLTRDFYVEDIPLFYMIFSRIYTRELLVNPQITQWLKDLEIKEIDQQQKRAVFSNKKTQKGLELSFRKEEGKLLITSLAFQGLKPHFPKDPFLFSVSQQQVGGSTYMIVAIPDKAKQETRVAISKSKMFLDSMERKAEGKVVLYYEKDLEPLAERFFGEMRKIYEIVEKKIGVPIQVEIPLLLHHNRRIKSIHGAYPLFLREKVMQEKDEDFNSLFYWIYTHELVEFNLSLGLRTGAFSEARWYNDGIAEYASYRVSKELCPEIAEVNRAWRAEAYKRIQGRAQLLNWKGMGTVGVHPSADQKNYVDYVATGGKSRGVQDNDSTYGAALQFFLDLEKDYGEKIALKINRRLAQTKGLNTPVIILGAVEEASGQKDIKTRLQKY